MIEISLTDFVDFVISSGTPKLTKVNQVRNRHDYHPNFDFWKSLRDGIIEFHQTSKRGKSSLDDIMSSANTDAKQKRYPSCIRGYQKFLGRKKITWFNPPRARWGPSGISIRINPELGLSFDGKDYVIKLYFKEQKLSKRRIDIIIALLKSALGQEVDNNTHFAILDVPRGKMHSNNNPKDSLMPLLIGEATSFKTIWEEIEEIVEKENMTEVSINSSPKNRY